MSVIEWIITLLFSLALFVNALLFIPQALKLYKEKISTSTPLASFFCFIIIQLSAVMYGFIIHDYIIISGYLLRACHQLSQIRNAAK